MDEDFLLGRYDKELERRDKLTQAVNFPVTILVLVGSIIVTMVRDFSFQTKPLTIGFFVFVLGATGTIGVALFNVSRAYHGRPYEYLPRLKQLEEHLDTMDQDEFDEGMRRSIILAADRNALSNEARQGHLENGNVMLLVSVVFAACCGVLYVLDQIAKG